MFTTTQTEKKRVNMQKSTTISFRVSSELKTRLEDRAKLENKTLSEYTKSILDSSHAERIIEKVNNEFNELEQKTDQINLLVSDVEKELKSKVNNFNSTLEKHINFYEKKSNELAKNVAIFDQELSNAIENLESSKKLNLYVSLFCIFLNFVVLCVLVFVVFF